MGGWEEETDRRQMTVVGLSVRVRGRGMRGMGREMKSNDVGGESNEWSNGVG